MYVCASTLMGTALETLKEEEEEEEEEEGWWDEVLPRAHQRFYFFVGPRWLIVGAAERRRSVLGWSRGVAVGRPCTPSRPLISIYTAAGKCVLEDTTAAMPPPSPPPERNKIIAFVAAKVSSKGRQAVREKCVFRNALYSFTTTIFQGHRDN
ncbi:hypothetical protein E2C01_049313 [Portunus trituberculatus]|uniref:Uncharacterized protein n=1 Tax=Portunus trituberculatus TaxID=210409 RepID=A0A5B7GDX7_PORTR|nr:hypothetical protein [Portunus trituberculatus]